MIDENEDDQVIDQQVLDDILAHRPEQYFKEISRIIAQDPANTRQYLAFSMERVAYSLNEPLFLSQYKVLDRFTREDWRFLVSRMNIYGQDSLLHFLMFHTSFSTTYLQSIGLTLPEKAPEDEAPAFFQDKEIQVLTNTHPRIMALYKRAGLTERDIAYLHAMQGR